ncbi:MAG: hypothetical protein HUJ72_00875 [Blautia sp.]|nr:hypothetical protein [Blautia sp.]
MKTIWNAVTKNITWRTALAVILGNLILGCGIALLRFSLMGNDPYTASMLAISGGLKVGLGNYQLTLNIILLVIQLIWGRQYLGFGTIVNMCFLGYIVQFVSYLLGLLFGSMAEVALVLRVVVMFLSMMIVAFGLAMYQVADLGVAPYDYLALGMRDHFRNPYFIDRVITDGVCVLTIVIAVLTGFIGWEGSNLGLGTIICAFGLGPFINLFMPWNKKWMKKDV